MLAQRYDMKITETPYNDNNLPSFSELLGAGNIVPNIWYHKLRRDTGKSDGTAISILSELVFLYRCNNATEFQLNFKYFKKKFNFGLSQVKDAVVRLEKLGLVTRSLRTVSILDRSFANEMFLILNIQNVLKLNEGNDLKKFPVSLRNDDTSSGGSSLNAEDKTVKSQSLPRNCPALSAEISAGNNIDNNNKKSIDRFNRSSKSELKVLKEEKEEGEAADNELQLKKAQEANITAEPAKELKSCAIANSTASIEPCNIPQAEIAKEQSEAYSQDLSLAPSAYPTELAEQSNKSTPIWLKFKFFGKKLAEFYPLTEQDRDLLAEKSGRKFELHFINQLLLKISNQHPEYKFCHKNSVLNYMAKALAYELREVEIANKGCFKFKNSDRNTVANTANSDSFGQDPSTSPTPPNADSIWGKIRIKLTKQLENGEALDKSWFSKLSAIYDHDKKLLTLKAPSSFIRDRIAQQYGCP